MERDMARYISEVMLAMSRIRHSSHIRIICTVRRVELLRGAIVFAVMSMPSTRMKMAAKPARHFHNNHATKKFTIMRCSTILSVLI